MHIAFGFTELHRWNDILVVQWMVICQNELIENIPTQNQPQPFQTDWLRDSTQTTSQSSDTNAMGYPGSRVAGLFIPNDRPVVGKTGGEGNGEAVAPPGTGGGNMISGITYRSGGTTHRAADE